MMSAIKQTGLAVGADRSIGAILIDSGRLTTDAAEKILKLQKEEGVRFGDAAIRLGFLTESDIQQALSRQYGYPYLMPGDAHVDNKVVAAFKPFSPIVEQLRALRSQLMLRWFCDENNGKALSVVSPERSEGRSFIAANLAVVFSQLGERTLLIDADLRNPIQHVNFQLENKIGLSTVLAGRIEVSAAITRISGLVDLSVLPSGAIPPNPLELLNRPKFDEVISFAQQNFDVIIIDTSAGGKFSDCQVVSVHTRGAVLVTLKDVSLATQSAALVSELQQSNVRVVGAVLNSG